MRHDRDGWCRAGARSRGSEAVGCGHHPGVVDEHVEALDRGGKGRDRREVGEVETTYVDQVRRDPRLAQGGGRPVDVTGADDDVRAGRGEGTGECQPEARSPAGDDEGAPGLVEKRCGLTHGRRLPRVRPIVGAVAQRAERRRARRERERRSSSTVRRSARSSVDRARASTSRRAWCSCVFMEISTLSTRSSRICRGNW